MGIELIVQIAAVGILVAVAYQVLKNAGREDIATVTALAGLVIVLVLVVTQVKALFDTVIAMFNLY